MLAQTAPRAWSCCAVWLIRGLLVGNTYINVYNVGPSSSCAQTFSLPGSCPWIPVWPIAGSGAHKPPFGPSSPRHLAFLLSARRTPLCTSSTPCTQEGIFYVDEWPGWWRRLVLVVTGSTASPADDSVCCVVASSVLSISQMAWIWPHQTESWTLMPFLRHSALAEVLACCFGWKEKNSSSLIKLSQWTKQ